MPVVPVTPLLVFSPDDTTVFAHVGAAASNEVRVASASEDGKAAGVFKMDDFSHLNGIRVRPTVTLTAAGHVAPLYVTVTGCLRREVTHPSGMLVMKVQGFCIPAASDHRTNDVGYVVFLCSDNDEHEKISCSNCAPARGEHGHTRRGCCHYVDTAVGVACQCPVVGYVGVALEGCTEGYARQTPTAADRARADLLHRLLLNRLERHKALRVVDVTKRSSWCFDWAQETCR